MSVGSTREGVRPTESDFVSRVLAADTAVTPR